MADSCIFCRIIAGEVPAPRIYEDEDCIVVRDIHPQAKVHLLVMPKRHVAHLHDLSAQSDGTEQMGRLLMVAAKVAAADGLMPGGYRLVLNTNPNGGQSVYHLHAHILGGEPLRGNFGI
jgi:histidine triad (HIT) family protein